MRVCQVNKHIFDIKNDGEVACNKCSITYIHYVNQIEQHAVMDRLAINDYEKAKDLLLKHGSVKKAAEAVSQ